LKKIKKLKALFLIYHPVDPQIALNTAKQIEKDEGEILFVIIEKEGIIKKIVESHSFNNIVISSNKKTVIGKVLHTVTVVSKLFTTIKNYKPDIIFSPTSPYSSLACAFNRIPLVCWADTESATTNIKLSAWRINSILIPQSFYKKIKSSNVIRFNGYKELSYLHPNVFNPNSDVLIEQGLSTDEKIVLMRFSALNAMHDIGLKSKSITKADELLFFIKKIETVYNARVLISTTERSLDSRFDKYKLEIEPSKYIQLLSFCSLYFGEGTTSASEAGILGIPWVVLSETDRGYLNDQENNYGLGITTNKIDVAFLKAEEYLSDSNIKNEWTKKRTKLLADKIDVSAFFSWFIINYPQSHNTIRDNPNYQNRFK
jgi:uncharacterized protein